MSTYDALFAIIAQLRQRCGEVRRLLRSHNSSARAHLNSTVQHSHISGANADASTHVVCSRRARRASCPAFPTHPPSAGATESHRPPLLKRCTLHRDHDTAHATASSPVSRIAPPQRSQCTPLRHYLARPEICTMCAGQYYRSTRLEFLQRVRRLSFSCKVRMTPFI